MKEPTAETELRWSELKRAADFFDLLPEGTAIEAHLGKLEESDRRKVVGLARWFIAARAEERERCGKIADAAAADAVTVTQRFQPVPGLRLAAALAMDIAAKIRSGE